MISRIRDRVSDRPAEAESERRPPLLPRLRAGLTKPVDSAGLAIVRMGVGSMIAWEVWREIDSELLWTDYIEPVYHFRWSLFEWVHPLPGVWIFVAFGILAAAGLLVAIGLFYRVAAAVMFLGITYYFLLDQARYLNHRYLACLLAFLLILMPAHASYSIDARRTPWVRTRTMPAWPLWLMRLQVGIPYFFGGIAKLNFDWLVRTEPLATWLRERMDFPVIGRFFADDIFIRLLAWGSTALDLFVVFLLLYKRTRAIGYALAVMFHFMNSRLFNIGIFPWTMILVTTIFFEPDWPRRMGAALRRGRAAVRVVIGAAFLVGFFIGGFLPLTFSAIRALIGGFGVAVAVFHLMPERLREEAAVAQVRRAEPSPWRRFTFSRRLAWFLAIWTGVQLLVPFRHFVIPGNAHWTEEGNRFSWHMLLRQKRGEVAFIVTDPATGHTGAAEEVDELLTAYQRWKMEQTPDMIVQFAHHLEDYYREVHGFGDLEIRLDSIQSLNGRIPQKYIDPDVDLTEIPIPYWPPGRWIVPLEPYE